MEPKKNHATALCYAFVRPVLGGIKYSRNIIPGIIHFLGYSYPHSGIILLGCMHTPDT